MGSEFHSEHDHGVSMSNIVVRCDCGSVEMHLSGEPIAQYVCHCDDCQAVHGEAYAVALYPTAAVVITQGHTTVFTLRTSPRTKCIRCERYLFAEVPGHPVRGINGGLLPKGVFTPEFHAHCRYAHSAIEDDLPHYKDVPIRFRGSGELMPR
jgi:hypothetical protein